MIKDFRKTTNLKKNKNGQFIFFYILHLPHTVISNSEKLTHPNVHHSKPIILNCFLQQTVFQPTALHYFLRVVYSIST